jgi:hypothetical protein
MPPEPEAKLIAPDYWRLPHLSGLVDWRDRSPWTVKFPGSSSAAALRRREVIFEGPRDRVPAEVTAPAGWLPGRGAGRGGRLKVTNRW